MYILNKLNKKVALDKVTQSMCCYFCGKRIMFLILKHQNADILENPVKLAIIIYNELDNII